MNRFRKLGVWTLGVLLAIAAYRMVKIFVWQPSAELSEQSNLLAEALRDVRQVTFIEYVVESRSSIERSFDVELNETIETPMFSDREHVLQSVVAKPEQLSIFRRATGPILTFDTNTVRSISRCFDPHHRVVVTHEDGSESKIDICFLCQNWRVADSQIRRIPPAFQQPLTSFFSQLGMPPRTREDYEKLIPPEPFEEQTD